LFFFAWLTFIGDPLPSAGMSTQDTYPAPLTLRGSKAQFLLSAIVMGVLVFACGGIGLFQGLQDMLFWIFIAFFVALFGLSLWLYVRPAPTLTLTVEGFEYRTAVMMVRQRWEDVAAFGWGSVNRNPAVYYKFASGYTGKKPALSGLSNVLSQGFEMYVPAIFGMDAEAQAALMARWHARRIGGGHA
jgi:hypothetical protein